MKLKPDKLTERESRILTLTGNKIAMYNIDGLPEKSFSVEVSYEYYECSKLLETNVLGGISTSEPLKKKEKIEIGVIIFDNKEISTVLRIGAGTSTSRINLESKTFLDTHISGFLDEEISLRLGSEIYILQASKGSIFTSVRLGENIDKEYFKSVLESQDETFLIKISIKESDIKQ